MQNNEIFEKNLDALGGSQYENLVESLKEFKELRAFSLSFGKDALEINITKKSKLQNIYQDPLKELEANLEKFKFYKRYPFLFFYGLGNGILYKALLKNNIHKRMIVFEKELEIIAIVLHLVDFSEDLFKGRFIILHTDDYSYGKAGSVFRLDNMQIFLRTYDLHIHCDFYKKNYKEDIIKINDLNLKAMSTLALKQGNDPGDALMGIRHNIINLPKVIAGPKLGELKKKRLGKVQNAIVVSTGPSLKKQLPLLKKYANRASIFCLDSSYHLLHKEGIKPDYVLSLERIALTSEFFNNDYGAFDEGVLFILPSLTHPNSIKYLEKTKRSYMFFVRSLPFSLCLDLKDYGYFAGGMSVAHLACEFAVMLGHKNIILIGQDLAYGKQGQSHSQGYVNAYIHENEFKMNKSHYTTTAYGGKGEVESSQVWTLFRRIFEEMFESYNTINFYNATQGGARIEGAIEKPFKWCCEELLDKELKKPFAKLKKPKQKESLELMLKNYRKIKKFTRASATLLKKCKKTLKMVSTFTRGISNVSLDTISLELDKIKDLLGSPKYAFLAEILGPSLYQQESLFSKLYVQDIQNQTDQHNKMVAWIYSHESWLEDIIDLLMVQDKSLKESIMPLQDLLEKKNMI